MPHFRVTVQRTVVRPVKVRQIVCVTVRAADAADANLKAEAEAGGETDLFWRDWPGSPQSARVRPGEDFKAEPHAIETVSLD